MSQTITLLYERIMEKIKELIVFGSAVAVIHWDTETMMPPRAVKLRSEQMSLMRRIEHRMGTDPEIGRLLKEIIEHPDYDSLDLVQKRNIYLIKKRYDEQTALPEDLVAKTAKQRVITTETWKKAKAAKDFSILKPELAKLVELRREAAEILMDVKGTETSYDALIDIFEPKMTERTLTKIFEHLQQGLTRIMEDIKRLGEQQRPDFLMRRIPVEIQRRIAVVLAESLGYDVTSSEAGGRIDETEHPFTTGYYDDVRITTHYYEDNFTSSIFSVLHEAGHALYDQNIRREWMYQPVGSPCSYGLNESQSRFVENIIGRSREFWVYFLPRLKEIAGSLLSDVDLDSFVKAINIVKPSKIRVEADEVTYCLHIIIRFNLERDLFAEKISVEDLPELWRQMYNDYLGVKIENDSEGVMQDTHWPSGLFGYFPSYALGNIYGGQILEALVKDIPDWKTLIAEGKIRPIIEWLARNIYAWGNLYDPTDLIKKITGRDLQVEPYLRYLTEKHFGTQPPA
ncbi:MAG: carboxypeptidase M32 [Nitrososphaerota archaeon]|nr:carboxypeptidase M32 [Candidatus Bathyarchaeota archaeon]MDW8049074.1 carboxypeptidase M32 [Nitrososphaerota archaeon]